MRAWSAVLSLGAVLILALAASPASAATKVFDGSSFGVKPSTLTGWPSDGTAAASSRVLVKGLHQPNGPFMNDAYESIKWKFWKKKKAVGVGTGWTPNCEAPCSATNPWDGTRLRVTAFRERGGEFTRLKIFQWTRWMKGPAAKRENYDMKLAYTGLKSSGLSWRVLHINHGFR